MGPVKAQQQSVLMFIVAILTHIVSALFRIVVRIKQPKAQT